MGETSEEGSDEIASAGDGSDCEEFERHRRNFGQLKNFRQLLPAKGRSGLIFRSEEIEDVEETFPLEANTNNANAENAKPSTPQNFVQLYARQRSTVDKLKIRVGVMCCNIVEDPESNIKALKELIVMLQNNNTSMIITEKKLMALSLLHVFTDVLPGYRIRTIEDQEKKTKMKKETRRLLDYEMTLLRNYKKYLDCLHGMVRYLSVKGQKQVDTGAKRKAFQEIGIVAVKCLCNLMISKVNFNYFKNIANIIVPLATHRNDLVSKICCEAIGKLYKSDKLGDASLEVVKLTCKILKERKFSVPPNLMKTLMSLNVQEAKVKGDNKKKDMKKLRNKLNMMSRKEKKHSKKMRDLENQLHEVEAQESVEKKSKFHTEILQRIFWVYFHVIKDSEKFLLLSPVLEGLSKFAHLINLEYFDDLSLVLCCIMENTSLEDTAKFHCMQTMFTILLGHAESLSVDPQKMYNHLYRLLLNLNLNSPVGDFVLAANCIDLMIVKRKKKLSKNRILAFMKRLCTTALQAPLPGLLICLSIIRKIVLAASSSDCLLDTEDSVGSGMFLPELEDPEHCNAHSTALWELQILLQHPHPVVTVFVNHILHGCPIQGGGSLPNELSKMDVDDILVKFSAETMCDERNVEKKKSKKRKMPFVVSSAKRQKLCNSLNTEKIVITWRDVKNVNFAS